MKIICGVFPLGLNDKGQQRRWKWPAGQSLSYTNWKPGQPDSDSDIRYIHMIARIRKDVWTLMIYLYRWSRKSQRKLNTQNMQITGHKWMNYFDSLNLNKWRLLLCTFATLCYAHATVKHEIVLRLSKLWRNGCISHFKQSATEWFVLH